jgi:hypothetical protein
VEGSGLVVVEAVVVVVVVIVAAVMFVCKCVSMYACACGDDGGRQR